MSILTILAFVILAFLVVVALGFLLWKALGPRHNPWPDYVPVIDAPAFQSGISTGVRKALESQPISRFFEIKQVLAGYSGALDNHYHVVIKGKTGTPAAGMAAKVKVYYHTSLEADTLSTERRAITFVVDRRDAALVALFKAIEEEAQRHYLVYIDWLKYRSWL